ncbi:MAG: DUF2779 domain-containing protein [Bacilli bacterium]|nr:DUF2779 domain-containing protein [Bacilli bacterium]
MAITKTKFINYIRCPFYSVLDKVKANTLDTNITVKEYKDEEEKEILAELLDLMYDENGEDLIDIKDEHLEVMLPYYNKVELIAGELVEKRFAGTPKYSKETLNQESFDCLINGIRYVCYVDIYNDRGEAFDIIEVKATTTNKFLKLGKSYTDSMGDKQITSIFVKDEAGIYRLRDEIKDNIFTDMLPEKDYLKHKIKLFDRYHGAGHYVYDLAVQRFIIENDLRENNDADKIDKIRYYLAVLNSNYIFAGEYLDGEPNYKTDENGNDIIEFIDLTEVTKDYMIKIKLDQEQIGEYIKNPVSIDSVVGNYCELKKTTKCKFTPVCFRKVPKENSILNYIDNHHGFTDLDGTKYFRYDLINEGKVNMLDIPESWLTREKNVIQREVVSTNKPYINKKKIQDGLKVITYPIYHLDFETFPCPLPRYRGEKPYSQSVFQFSLHIERTSGVCDRDKDHYEYLAKDHNDNREELVKKLIEYIDTNKGGTILVYNQSFEKTRIKELGEIFPQYQKEMKKMSEMLFDLMYLAKTNTKFYEDLGYETEEAQLFNYYHKDLNGSFSIKKLLPIFTNIKYSDLEVSNGVDAIVTYASFNKLSKEEYNNKYQALLEYCKQDTYSMVEILNSFREIVK